MSIKIAAAAAVAAALLGGCSVSVDPPESTGVSQGLGSQDASGDVTLGAPVSDGYGFSVEVPVTVTNPSEKRSNYWIEIAAEAPDGTTKYDDTIVVVNNVEPGQSAVETAMFFSEMPEGTVFVVKEVERTSAVG